MNYAIVDLEASGGKKFENRIIEIGIILTDGHQIEQTYQTLVNPKTTVSKFVEKLTGIYSAQLIQEKPFSVFATKIFEMLKGRIFVAHNVSFDYSLLREELKRCGLSLELPRLCSMKLARKAFPKLSSYSLGSVCNHLNHPLQNAHRALDDALGAYEILKAVIEQYGEEFAWKQATHKGIFGFKKQQTV